MSNKENNAPSEISAILNKQEKNLREAAAAEVARQRSREQIARKIVAGVQKFRDSVNFETNYNKEESTLSFRILRECQIAKTKTFWLLKWEERELELVAIRNITIGIYSESDFLISETRGDDGYGLERADKTFNGITFPPTPSSVDDLLVVLAHYCALYK
jgi:hypothetical protein